tara:strand:+ start:4762 stop:5481 length:720 start_codon:yes stop_codon:yes gene_type:complete
MSLATSGLITLDQIHQEAGGTTTTACSINDQDIRNLYEAPGKTLNKTQGTAVDFGDFHGASNDPRISLTGSPSLSGTLTINESYSTIYIVNSQITTRFNGFVASSYGSSGSSGGGTKGAWLNGSETWMNVGVEAFYCYSTPYVLGMFNPNNTYSFVIDKPVFNSGWTSISLYHPYSNYSNPYVFTRASASYSYTQSQTGVTVWSWILNADQSSASNNLLLGSPRTNALQGTSYQTLVIA